MDAPVESCTDLGFNEGFTQAVDPNLDYDVNMVMTNNIAAYRAKLPYEFDLLVEQKYNDGSFVTRNERYKMGLTVEAITDSNDFPTWVYHGAKNNGIAGATGNWMSQSTWIEYAIGTTSLPTTLAEWFGYNYTTKKMSNPYGYWPLNGKDGDYMVPITNSSGHVVTHFDILRYFVTKQSVLTGTLKSVLPVIPDEQYDRFSQTDKYTKHAGHFSPTEFPIMGYTGYTTPGREGIVYQWDVNSIHYDNRMPENAGMAFQEDLSAPMPYFDRASKRWTNVPKYWTSSPDEDVIDKTRYKHIISNDGGARDHTHIVDGVLHFCGSVVGSKKYWNAGPSFLNGRAAMSFYGCAGWTLDENGKLKTQRPDKWWEADLRKSELFERAEKPEYWAQPYKNMTTQEPWDPKPVDAISFPSTDAPRDTKSTKDAIYMLHEMNYQLLGFRKWVQPANKTLPGYWDESQKSVGVNSVVADNGYIITRIDKATQAVTSSDFFFTGYGGNTRGNHLAFSDTHVYAASRIKSAAQVVKLPLNFAAREKPVISKPVGGEGGRTSQNKNGIITFDHYYDANNVQVLGNDVYFNFNGPMSLPLDFDETTNATLIPFFDDANPIYGAYRSANYGMKIVGGYVYYLYHVGSYGAAPADFNAVFEASAADVNTIFSRNPKSVILKVDPSTKKPVKRFTAMFEEMAHCEGFGVTADEKWAVIACGNQRMEGGYSSGKDSLHKVRLTETLHVTSSAHINDRGLSAMKKTPGGEMWKTSVSGDGISIETPGGIRMVDILATDYPVLKLNREKQVTFVGNNIANMGRGHSEFPNFPNATHLNSVIVGSNNANWRGGIMNSVIIGTNMMNAGGKGGSRDIISREVGKGLLYDANGEIADGYHHEAPLEGKFAIGINHKPLIEGSFKTQTVNLPGISSLAQTQEKVNADKIGKMADILFVKDNIVQVATAGIQLDGVQKLKDELTSLKIAVCQLKDTNATLESCTSQQATVSADIMILSDRERFPSEVTWSIEKCDEVRDIPEKTDGPDESQNPTCKTVLSWKGEGDKFEAFEFGLTFIEDSEDKCLWHFSQEVTGAYVYRFRSTDSYGDGPQMLDLGQRPENGGYMAIFKDNIEYIFLRHANRWESGSPNTGDYDYYNQEAYLQFPLSTGWYKQWDQCRHAPAGVTIISPEWDDDLYDVPPCTPRAGTRFRFYNVLNDADSQDIGDGLGQSVGG